MDGKRCSKCKEWRPRELYTKNKNSPDELEPACQSCAAHARRKTRYGLEPEEYLRMLFVQNARCMICDRRQDELTVGLMVDHNHTTGKVRGLLCRECNLGLANFFDAPQLLTRAAEYLILMSESQGTVSSGEQTVKET